MVLLERGFRYPKSFIKVLLSSVLFTFSMQIYAVETETSTYQEYFFQDSVKNKIKGVVLDTSGLGLPGAVIVEKNTTNGVNSNLDGSFEINLTKGISVLEVSYLGYDVQEIHVKTGGSYTIILKETSDLLNEVVVTALGIKREEKQLGYAQQTLQSEDLNHARSNNWTDGLKGKVAGVSLLSSNSGPMNSAQIKLRGDRSIDLGNNSALVVVDGVIVGGDLWSSGSNDAYISNDTPVDFGNGISDLNPDDIESITVLKGAGASALYGSRASNGVLMITTKSGKKQKGLGISFNSNVSFDVIQHWPDYQYEYGQGTGKSFDKDGNPYYSYGASEDGGNTGSTSSAFGPKFEGQEFFQYDPTTEGQGASRTLWRPYKNNIKGFWKTGVTTTNSLSFSGGNDQGDIRATITNSHNEWIMPNTGFDRTSISTKSKYKVSKAITVNSNVSFSNRNSDNLPGTGYGNHSIGYFMIFQNPNVDLNWYRPIWKQGSYQTEQIHPFSSFIENPYLIAYETTNAVNANTINGNLSTDIRLAPKLKLMLRGALNSRADKREQRRPYDTSKFGRGHFKTQQINFQEVNTDFLLTYDHATADPFTYNASVGGNMMNSKWHSVTAFVDGLVVPGLYMLANGVNSPITRISDDNYKVNSLYAMGAVGYKNVVFLDATIRNDWSSTIQKGSWSFMYPSINTSFILNDIFRMPTIIDYSKVRFSVAEVGNGTKSFRTLTYYNNDDFPSSAIVDPVLINENLKPEKTTSLELGYEHKMFKNRLGFDVTLYETMSKNQIITVPLNYVTGYNRAIINGGKVRNRGIEVVLNGTPIKNKNFSWNTTLNWAKNENAILTLAEGFDGGDQQVLAQSGTVQIIGKVGGSTGDMYGYKFVRNDAGDILYTEKGLPIQSKEIEYVGNAYADWSAGWVNTFKYKNVTLSFTIDGQYGGIVYSQTHHKMSEQGKLGHTLYGRDQGFIIGEGVVPLPDGSFTPNTTKVEPSSYYAEYYRRANVESNSFDASYVKLRDLSIEYNFSKTVLERLRLKKLSISAFGRNLAMLSNFPIFDPETAALNGGSMVPGVEMGQMPSPATYGFNIKVEL